MSKLRIEMTGPVHQTECRVLYGDTDSGGVVYYGNFLRYFEMGRTELMRFYGVSYKELEGSGFIMPVVENYVRYKASAYYDDQLVVHTSLCEVKSVSCRFNYKIFRKKDQQLLVKGFTVHAVVNRDGRLVKLPKETLVRLKEITDKGA